MIPNAELERIAKTRLGDAKVLMVEFEAPEAEEQLEEVEPSEELLQKLRAISLELRRETGGLVLFGLFEPSDAPGRWDLLVAADWVDPRVLDATAYVAERLQSALTAEELMFPASVITLPSSHAFVRELLNAVVEVDGGPLKITNRTFNGIHVQEAWLFVADINGRSNFKPTAYVAPEPPPVKPKAGKTPKSAVRRR